MTSVHAVKNHHNENNIDQDMDDRKLFVKGSKNTRIHYKPDNAPSFEDDFLDSDLTQTQNTPSKPMAKRSVWFRMMQFIGIVGSLAWLSVCLIYFTSQGELETQTPYEFGIFMAGTIAPVAFFWMLLSYMQRNSDVRYYAENMRKEMHTLFFPSEQDSVRVNKDIELMTQQAAEIASSSKAALKSIHRARMGLRHEIKQFASLARQAESHILSLSDGMVEKTGNLVEKTDVVQARIDRLSLDSDKALQSWEEAGALMIERAAEIEATMDKGANHILSMADVAEEKSKAVSEMFDGTINELNITINTASERFGAINDTMASHTKSIEQTSLDLSKESGRLNAIIDDQIEQLNDTTGRSIEGITQSVLSIQDQKDSMAKMVDDLAIKAEDIASVIQNSSGLITDSTHNISETIDTIETRLEEKTSSLQTALNSFDSQIDRIDSISNVASHRLNEGIDTAVNGAMQISTAIHHSIDKMDTATNNNVAKATQKIELLSTHIDDLKKSEMDHLSQAQRLADLLEQNRSNIERAAQKSETFIHKLNETVDNHGLQIDVSSSTLHEQIKSITNALEEPMRLISIAVADADGRHEQIQSTLERRIDELNKASDKATESAETIRITLRDQTKDILDLSNKMTAQNHSLHTTLKENQIEFDNAIKISGSAIQGLINQMSEVSDDLTFITDETSTNLMQFNTVLESSSSTLQTMATKSQTVLSQHVEAYKDQLDSLNTSVNNAVDNIKTQASTYQQTSAEIIPALDKVNDRTKNNITSLDELNTTYQTVSQSMLGKIEDATSIFDTRLSDLQSGSEKASGLLRSSGDYLQTCLENIQDAASSADIKMTNIGKTIESQSSNIHIVADKTTLRLESIHNLINEQFTYLSNAIDQSVEQIETAGQTFDRRADKVSATAEDVLEQIINAGDGAETKALQLKTITADITTVSGEAVEMISNQINHLATTSEDSLLNIRKTADTLSIRSKEIDTMMSSVLSKAQSYGQNMREQVNMIAITSGESAATIEQSLHGLSKTMNDIHGQTQSVTNFVDNANKTLLKQTNSFVTSVKQSSIVAENTTSLFAKQSDALIKASNYALQKAQQVKDAEIKASRDTFMSSARFVLESLHSLSIDFVRMIDGEVSDKDWKSYSKGNVAVFTTQLAQRLNELPADKIRNKYADDSEFRSYVQKFVRQFEDILHQTDTIDRGAILSTTFAASDVGKIYHYLNTVIGVDNNVKKVKVA